MLTAATITDEQIKDLFAEAGRRADDGDVTLLNTCGFALGNTKRARAEARARIAEILNARTLTPRQRDLLYHQLSDDFWCTPRFLGGTDGSHHSTTLAQLVRKGLAERRARGGHTRSAWEYRRTSAGERAAQEIGRQGAVYGTDNGGET